MSVFGDDRPHMNDWIDGLEQRAEDVGARQAVKEFAEVLSTFAEYYWPEQPNYGYTDDPQSNPSG